MTNPFKAIMNFFTGGIKERLVDLLVDSVLSIANQQITDTEAYDMGAKVGKRIGSKLTTTFGQKPGQRVEDLLQLKFAKLVAGMRDALDNDDV